jgi:YegS/Rv2252/BmrU family lipid kinase
MPNPETVLIVNPKTGRYRVSTQPSSKSLSSYLNSLGIRAEVFSTTAPGDATRLAAEAVKEGVRQVIVFGGDGTINEAMQPLVGSSTRLAILPGGTANVLARELGLPLALRAAAEVIARGNSRRVHVGLAIDEQRGIYRHFLLMAGIGLDAAVVRSVNPNLKRRLGKGAFWLTGLSQLANWNPIPFTIEVNGQTYKSTFVSIGNAPSYGGNLGITPGASLDQPEFEICVVQTTSRIKYLHLLSNALRKRGLQPVEKGLCFVRSREARATGNVAVQVDGDVIGVLPMRFEVAPDYLELVVP